MENAYPIILQVLFYLVLGAALYLWFKWDIFLRENKQYSIPFILFQLGVVLLAVAMFLVDGWLKVDLLLIGVFLIGFSLLLSVTMYIMKKLRTSNLGENT